MIMIATSKLLDVAILYSKVSSWAGEKAQQLRVCTALAEDLCWIFSTHTGNLTSMYNLRSRQVRCLWTPWAMHLYSHALI